MKKRIFGAALCLALTLNLSLPALAADTAATAAVVVNGVTADNVLADVHSGTTYISFYYGTLALRPDASVAWQEDRLVATAEDLAMSAKIGSQYMVVNGRYLYIPEGVKMDETGDTMVPTRTLAKALGAEVAWNGAVEFTTGGSPLASGDGYYDAATVDLLARVITHESGNQPLAGKIAVGNVIMNRVNSPSFPNTVSEVIYAPNQFPGATNATPNSESIVAAKLCLEGANVVPGAYWFNGAGKSCWASRNKATVAVIGGHAFYG